MSRLLRFLFRRHVTQITEAIETLTETVDAIDDVLRAGNAFGNEIDANRDLVSDWNAASGRFAAAHRQLSEIDIPFGRTGRKGS